MLWLLVIWNHIYFLEAHPVSLKMYTLFCHFNMSVYRCWSTVMMCILKSSVINIQNALQWHFILDSDVQHQQHAYVADLKANSSSCLSFSSFLASFLSYTMFRSIHVPCSKTSHHMYSNSCTVVKYNNIQICDNPPCFGLFQPSSGRYSTKKKYSNS